jgi:SEC-C motif-containing protein
MKISANKPCLCYSGRKAKGCCGPVLRGQLARTPEALMRSRYSAYAAGALAYLMNTTHPDGPHFQADRAGWETELRAFCRAMSFDGLIIHEASEEGGLGFVDFTAQLSQDGQDRSFRERSRFVRAGGRWFYLSADSG